MTKIRRKAWLYPLDGSAPHTFPMSPSELWLNWGADSGSAFIAQIDGQSAKIFRLDTQTGDRLFLRQVAAADPVGGVGIPGIRTTSDGRSYAFSYETALSELYLVTGLK
jgi:hypothetical protein